MNIEGPPIGALLNRLRRRVPYKADTAASLSDDSSWPNVILR